MIFLRPWGFLALFFTFFWLWHKRRLSRLSPWISLLDKPLWEALHTHHLQHQWISKKTGLMFVLWLLWTLALAGPAWYKIPVPTSQQNANAVIVMDLNVPNEALKKLQMRLYDLADILKEHRVALVLYGTNEAYTAMPLTPDVKLIQQLAPDITPDDLPEPATNPQIGVHYAGQLLDQAGQRGIILFLTTQSNTALSSQYPIKTVDLETNLTPEIFLPNITDMILQASDIQTETWQDMGIWILLLSLPVLAYCFRKNVFYLFLAGWVLPVEAGFLMRPDQEPYHQEMRGVQAYHSGDYSRAEKLFSSAYNRGNALAFQGQIKEAIDAYQQALDENPNDSDAKFNKEYLEKQLPPPEEQSQPNENQQENAQSSSEAKTDSSQNQPDENTQPTEEQTIQELEQALADDSMTDNENQTEQQILNRVNQDPARVLRYRLNLQHQRNHQ